LTVEAKLLKKKVPGTDIAVGVPFTVDLVESKNYLSEVFHTLLFN
jgi:hypothetical protein